MSWLMVRITQRICCSAFTFFISSLKKTGSRKNETIMLKKLNAKACHDKQYITLPSLAHTVHPSYMVLSCSFRCVVWGILLVSICTVAEGKMTWSVEWTSRTQETRVDSGLVEQCPRQLWLKCGEVHDLRETILLCCWGCFSGSSAVATAMSV